MTQTPYTKAYTENLIASLERTRQELKDLIEVLVNGPEGQKYKVPGQMHRMVSGISDDLEG